MPRRESVHIDGINALRRALREVEQHATKANAVEESAQQVVRLTQSAVNVDTGELHDSVVARPDRKDKRTYFIGWPGSVRYSWKQEYGTKYIPANPALTSAAEQVAADLRRRVTAQVRSAAR